MTGDRHQKLGIKQTIQRHWMDRTVQMMLAGMPEGQIRAELDEYLSTQRQSGGTGERGQKTYGMAIPLLSAWFAPEQDLAEFRDGALRLAGNLPTERWLALHWAVMSASYPFWFNVAKQAGRLLNLQGQITRAQVLARVKERYGDRETVSRNTQYTVRSFVAWGALRDAGSKGCYEKAKPLETVNEEIANLLIESALLATPGSKGAMAQLHSNPAFFPFDMPFVNGDLISRRNSRISVVHAGLDGELLQLK